MTNTSTPFKMRFRSGWSTAIFCMMIFSVSAAAGTLPSPASTKSTAEFIHPGVMHTSEDIARIKAHLAVEPWASGYLKLKFATSLFVGWDANPNVTMPMHPDVGFAPQPTRCMLHVSEDDRWYEVIMHPNASTTVS
jgi:hypothetical protein